jgi:predicted neutral ceramidase superfamily lipid hydrolase
VHAVFTSIWLLILSAQVLLVEFDNVKFHRKFGWFAAAWATLLVLIAAWGELSWEATNLHTPGTTPAFLAIPVGNLLSFATLITWGILLRKNLAAHRRVMFLANVSIMTAGAARLFGNVFHFSFTTPVGAFFFYYSGSLILLLLMLLWDLWKNRVMQQFLIGAVFIVALQVISMFLFFNEAWTNIARSVIEAWGRFAL